MKEFYDPATYDRGTQGVPGDVEFFLGQAKRAHENGHPVLELACGTGRVSIPIARAGVTVVGLDRSASMLARAAEKAEGLANVRWVEGDMREFELPERFGLIFVPFRSFQHLMSIDDQLACLRCVHRHLVPGGRLAIDIFNPDIVQIGQWLTNRRGGLQRRREDYATEEEGRVSRAWESREYRPAEQEVRSTFLDETVDEQGAVVSRRYRDLKLRYIYRYEMEHLLVRAGFEIEALYGDCYAVPFSDTSPEQVWIAVRPAE